MWITRQPSWMTHSDPRILHSLAEISPAKTQEIADNVYYTQSTVQSRIRVLKNYGLVQHVTAYEYRITETGRKALENEIDVREIEPNDPDGPGTE